MTMLVKSCNASFIYFYELKAMELFEIMVIFLRKKFNLGQ